MLQVQGAEHRVNSDLMFQAYSQCTQNAFVPYARVAFPSFTQIYDEYATIIIEEVTKRDVKSLNDDFKYLEAGEINVENGFLPEQFGIHKKAELFDLLISYCVTFEHDEEIYNSPIQEVW